MVGLRNPGTKYEKTRHNIGAEVVDALASRCDTGFRRAKRFIRAEVAEVHIGGHAVVLAKPTTFMNEAGQAVAPLVRYYRTDRDRLLVVHDDIDLPFAKLRVAHGSGAGGNNGIRSVIRSLRGQDFWRLKCGVGRPPGRVDPADFVLRRFTSRERPDVDVMVQLAADVAESFVTRNGDAARQRAGEMNTGLG